MRYNGIKWSIVLWNDVMMKNGNDIMWYIGIMKYDLMKWKFL